MKEIIALIFMVITSSIVFYRHGYRYGQSDSITVTEEYTDEYTEIKEFNPSNRDSIDFYLNDGYRYICTKVLYPSDPAKKYQYVNIYLGK